MLYWVYLFLWGDQEFKWVSIYAQDIPEIVGAVSLMFWQDFTVWAIVPGEVRQAA